MFKSFQQWFALLPLAFASASIAAPVTTIDFEALPSMTFWAGSPVPTSARLSNQLLSTHGVVFSSADPWVAVVNLGLGHATSGVNGIGASRENGVLTYDKAFPIAVEFFDTSNSAVKAVTDFVSLRGDMGGSGQTIWLRAYDLLGNEIAASSGIDSGGATLSVSAAGIHSVKFFGTQDWGGVAVDDFSFGALTSTVPEPSSVALVLPLAALVFARRRQNARS